MIVEWECPDCGEVVEGTPEEIHQAGGDHYRRHRVEGGDD